MALPPHLSFLRIGAPEAAHTIELWIDYVCPYSGEHNEVYFIKQPPLTIVWPLYLSNFT